MDGTGVESVRVRIGVHPDHGGQAIELESGAGALASRDGFRVAATGEVYAPVSGRAADVVAATYDGGGIDAVTRLEGSFMAVVVDSRSGATMVVNDVVSSRKAYIGRLGDQVWVANSLADLPLERFSVSPAGVGSYLACDGTHGGLTPYEGIRALQPGSVAQLRGATVTVERYGTADPKDMASGDREERTRAYAAEMRVAVERRLRLVPADGRVYLSLSGGHDSKGLLGFLTESLPAHRIATFSYRHRSTGMRDDPVAASEAASRRGVPHHFVPGYRGDFMATLQYNAAHGDGVAHFCDDADVWAFLEQDPFGEAPAAVFVGDRRNHLYSSIMRDLDLGGVLGFANVEPSSVIGWFLDGLRPVTAAEIRDGWNEEYQSLGRSLVVGRDGEAAAMAVSVEERIGQTLTLWRERFTSRVAPVSNPYLDRSVLDSMARMPFEWHDADSGSIHRAAIEKSFPDLFEGAPEVSGGWNMPGWGDEMQGHAADIGRLVRGVPSRLDELIPPDAVLTLLNQIQRQGGRKVEATSGIGWTVRRVARRSRRLRKLHQSSARRSRILNRTDITPSRLLRRLLTLRTAMSDAASVATHLDHRTPQSDRPA